MAAADVEHISVQEAFHLLLAARLQPHAARHRLEEALLTNEARLWVNGTVVDVNFIASHLRVAARTEPDGRWTAHIEPTRALVSAEYIWEMSLAEVEGLVGAPQSGETPEPATTKEGLAGQIIQALFGHPPHEIPKSKAKTGTVCTKVNAELKRRADAEGRKNYETISRDTVDRAMGRGKRRNEKS